MYRCLLARCHRAYAAAIGRLPGADHAAQAKAYEARAQTIAAYLRAGGPQAVQAAQAAQAAQAGQAEPWYASYGLHALAEAANAGVLQAGEVQQAVAQEFNDLGTVCSFSPFNTYFILQVRAPLLLFHVPVLLLLCSPSSTCPTRGWPRWGRCSAAWRSPSAAGAA